MIENNMADRVILLTACVLMLCLCVYIWRRSKWQILGKQSEIDRQNALLKNLQQEKEWLLKEVHHRVKNNLQIVISLLSTQSAYLHNPDAVAAIRNSEHRIYAMSLMHLKLYKSENMSAVDMFWYLQELVEYMRQRFDTTARIAFIVDADKVELHIVQAIPVGLILNEAISNAIKHAFAGRSKGNIAISLKRLDGDICQLTVADDGAGIAVEVDTKTNNTFGLNLMRGLTSQLDGTCTLVNKNGLVVQITFRINTQLYASELQALQTA